MESIWHCDFNDTEPVHTAVVGVGNISTSYLSDSQLRELSVRKFYSPDVTGMLQEKDLSLANLECPLTDVASPIVKSGPCLRGCSKSIALIEQGYFDIAVMANNHVLDHGAEGLSTTRKICHEAGIKTLGVGENDIEAKTPFLLDHNACRIAILSFAEREFNCATSDTPGAAVFELPSACKCISEVRSSAQFVIVIVHGGVELYPLPSPRVQQAYRFLIDCGADAVLGHHPHVIQGVETYKNKPIIYSVGNFFFPKHGAAPKCWNAGGILRMRFGASAIHSCDLFVCRTIESESAFQITSLTPPEHAESVRRQEQYSEILTTPRLLEGFFDCFCWES